MRILFLSAWFPYPPLNGAKLRIYNLLREMASFSQISLITFAKTIPIATAKANIPELEKYVADVTVVEDIEFDARSLRALRGLLSPLPRSVFQTQSQAMMATIKGKMASQTFDVIVVSEVGPPASLSYLASQIKGIPIIIDALEIGVFVDALRQSDTLWKHWRHRLTFYKLSRLTKIVFEASAACTVPSEAEATLIGDVVGDRQKIHVVPHGLDLSRFAEVAGSPEPRSLVFTGSFTYYPNQDAVEYFLGEILPGLREIYPDISFRVLGSTGDFALDSFAGDKGIEFVGRVEDVRPYIVSSWVTVVPLRVGAGTRLKIIESMALGVPVVSTTKGAEGLNVQNGQNILIADTPPAFTQAVLKLLEDPDLRQQLADNGRLLVREQYSAARMGDSLKRILADGQANLRTDKS